MKPRPTLVENIEAAIIAAILTLCLAIYTPLRWRMNVLRARVAERAEREALLADVDAWLALQRNS